MSGSGAEAGGVTLSLTVTTYLDFLLFLRSFYVVALETS